MTDIAIQIQIYGRVQGVGYRDWLGKLARTLELGGWVRNRHDGWVEAVLSGPPEAADAALALIERGPPGARVEDVAVRPAEAAEIALNPEPDSFAVLPDL